MAPTSTMTHGSKTPSGFQTITKFIRGGFVDDDEPLYARVQLCQLVNGEVRYGEEPIGIIQVSSKDVAYMKKKNTTTWVKYEGNWISSDQREAWFVRAVPITKIEYETDIAFELFPKLPVTRRPVRSWVKDTNNKRRMLKWNMFSSVFSLPMSSLCTQLMETPGDFWAWSAVVLFVHAMISIACFILWK